MTLTEHITPGGPLLEVLRRTEASLRDEPYEYFNWKQCTCGHVYAASTGGWATEDNAVIYSNDVTFLQITRYIVEATGGLRGEANLTDMLSARTGDCAEAAQDIDADLTNDGLRAAALQLIRTAIAKCEAEQLAAMHAVADEAQRVVSLVDVPEGVSA